MLDRDDYVKTHCLVFEIMAPSFEVKDYQWYFFYFKCFPLFTSQILSVVYCIHSIKTKSIEIKYALNVKLKMKGKTEALRDEKTLNQGTRFGKTGLNI